MAAILVGFSEAGLGGCQGDRAVVLGQVSPLSKKLEVSALREGDRANSIEFQTEQQGVKEAPDGADSCIFENKALEEVRLGK